MKKVLLIILLLISLTFSFSFNKVNADSLWYDYSRDWELYNYYSTYYGMRLYVNSSFDITTPDGFSSGIITFPTSSDNINTIGAVDSEIAFYDTNGLFYTGTLFGLFGWTTNFGGSVRFSQEKMVNGTVIFYRTIIYNSSDEIVSSFDNDLPMLYLMFNVMQNFSSPPSGYVSWWEENNSVVFYTIYLRIEYYVNLNIIASDILDGNIITPPTVTEPLNYDFVQWNTITGEKYDFNSAYYDVNWISTVNSIDTLKLFAQFKKQDTSADNVIEPTITDRVPPPIKTLMSDLNMNTPNGYIGFFVITYILIALFLLLVTLKVSNKTRTTSLFVSFVVYALFWIYLGAFPIWFVVCLIGILAYCILSLSNNKNDYTEESSDKPNG